MWKHLSLAALAVAVVAGFGYAQQKPNKVVIPVERTAATSGQQMYANYCAPCHGTDGKGNGPAASALKKQPTDLTTLARMNQGKFPEAHIVGVLQFGADVPAHGSAEMPVWGPILGKMGQSRSQEKQLRISNLTRYLQSIQAK